VKSSTYLKLSVVVNVSLAATLGWSAVFADGPGGVSAQGLSSLLPAEASLPFALSAAGGLVMVLLLLGALVEISSLLRTASPLTRAAQTRSLGWD
jgi:hypothetical protein